MIPLLAPIAAALSSFAGTVAQAFAKLGPTIISTVAKHLPQIKEAVKSFVEIAPKIGEAISAVVDVIGKIAQLLGLSKPETTPEKLGARALQHSEIKYEDCASAKEYVEKLESVPFDENSFKEMSTGERAVATAVGTALEMKCIGEKFMMNVPVQFYETAVKGDLKPSDVINLLGKLNENGIRDAGVIVKYFAGSASGSENAKLTPALEQYEKAGGKPVEAVAADIANWSRSADAR